MHQLQAHQQSSYKKHSKYPAPQSNQYHSKTNASVAVRSNNSNIITSPLSSQHSEQKDDIKEPAQHVGYSSGSNTISPQQSDPNKLQNRNTAAMNHPFTNKTVKDLASNLGFEEEYVRMALIQAAGDITFAAEILFRMSDKTQKAIKKIAKQKKKRKHSSNLNAKLISEIFGMNVKEIKRAWKLVIGDKSKSDLRALARRECLDDFEEDSDSSSCSENSDENGSGLAANNSFYKKNKAEIQNTLCQSAQNVLFVLRLYEKWKSVSCVHDENLYFHVLLDECLSHYGLIQLINDFQHIHIFHWDHCELFGEFEAQIHECCIAKCVSFQRHFRDRSLYKNDSKRYKLYALDLMDENDANKDRQSLNVKELLCIQWMDEVHCYLMHSLMRFETEDSEDSEDDDGEENETDSEQSHSLSVSQSTRKQKKRIIKKEKEDAKRENIKLMNQRKDELVQYGYGRSYGRTDYNEDDKNDTEDDEDSETLNIFEWQSLSQRASPRFATFRLEILNNPYYKLTINEWNELYLKSEQISRSWIRKRIKAKEKYKDDKMKIKKSEAISIELIMALKLYTDYDKLQYELKKCYRRNGNDLCHLYRWNHMLSIVVSKFGIRMKKHRFFYGLNSKHHLMNYCGFGLFSGPLSMTLSLEIAKQYAQQAHNNHDTEGGMLVQIGNAHPWIKDKDSGNGRYFDVSVLSDYKHEHEILTMSLTTRLHMISCNEFIDESLRNISPKLFQFVCGLFDKCILSMNYELEQIVVKLINNQIVKRNKRQIPSQHSYAFNKLCTEKEEVLLWDISYGLQEYFMVSTEYDDDFDDESRSRSLYMQQNDENDEEDTKLLISFEKINIIFPNLKALTLMNHTLSNEIFYQFIDYLNKNEGNVSYEIISFYFPKYKKLPLNLNMNQLHHVWNKYLSPYNYIIEGYKYGTNRTLSPMVVIKKIDCNRTPFIGENDDSIFVKIET